MEGKEGMSLYLPDAVALGNLTVEQRDGFTSVNRLTESVNKLHLEMSRFKLKNVGLLFTEMNIKAAGNLDLKWKCTFDTKVRGLIRPWPAQFAVLNRVGVEDRILIGFSRACHTRCDNVLSDSVWGHTFFSAEPNLDAIKNILMQILLTPLQTFLSLAVIYSKITFRGLLRIWVSSRFKICTSYKTLFYFLFNELL